MTDNDDDSSKLIHIRLNSYDREALAFMKFRFGTSLTGAVRACIRAAAQQVGFKSKRFPTDSE